MLASALSRSIGVEPECHPRHPDVGEVTQVPGVRFGAEHSEAQCRRISPGVRRHLLQPSPRLLDLEASLDRHPHVAQLDDLLEVPLGRGCADDDRWVRLLQRLGPGPRRAEVDELAVELGFLLCPQRLAGEQLLAHQGTAGGRVDAVGFHLLVVPAVADAEQEPTARDDVERGDLLGQPQRITLGDQGDPGAEEERRGDRRRGGEGDELVVRAPVHLRQRRGVDPPTPRRAA